MGRVAIGVDGYPRGWVGLRLVDGAIDHLRGYATFSDVLAANADADGIAVDMPIGLPVDAPRRADAAARRFLKGRSSSVFTTGPRAALERHDDHATASAIARATIGVGLSIQALSIAPKVLELDDLDLPGHVFEVHPEVSFQLLAEAEGLPVPLPRKRSWAGLRTRLELLSWCGVDLLTHPSEDLDPKIAPDDAIDAAVAAWTADGWAHQDVEMISFPDDPQRGPAIWARPQDRRASSARSVRR